MTPVRGRVGGVQQVAKDFGAAGVLLIALWQGMQEVKADISQLRAEVAVTARESQREISRLETDLAQVRATCHTGGAR